MGAQYDERIINQCPASELSAEFAKIVDACRYESGHGGYTGTFAESHGVKIVSRNFETIREASEYLNETAEKWGPALAVKAKHNDRPVWVIGAICSS